MTTNNLFAYGTLMIDEIFFSITGNYVKNTPGYLNNYICYRVRDKNYPGIISGNGFTTGVIYQDLPFDVILKLDDYEGNQYQRVKVLVNKDTTNQVPAWCFIYKEDLQNNLLKDLWTLQWYTLNKNKFGS